MVSCSWPVALCWAFGFGISLVLLLYSWFVFAIGCFVCICVAWTTGKLNAIVGHIRSTICRKSDRAVQRRAQQAQAAARIASQQHDSINKGSNVATEQRKQEPACLAISDSESEHEGGDISVYRCESCKKNFKSESMFDQHTRTKKHLQMVSKLGPPRSITQAEPILDHTMRLGNKTKTRADGPKQCHKAESSVKETCSQHHHQSGDDDSGDDDADDFIARCAARKQAQKSYVDRGEDNDSTKSGSSEAESVKDKVAYRSANHTVKQKTGVSKKAQKREFQTASLSEKKVQRESVQDLIGNCKKLHREAKRNLVQ